MGQETDRKLTGTKPPEQGDWNLLSGLIGSNKRIQIGM
jgi:hypothetical protein